MPEAVEVCIMRFSLTLVTNGVDDRTLVGTDVSRPLGISISDEDVIHRSLQWNVCAGNALVDTTWQVAFSNRCADGERFDRLRRALLTDTSALWLANFDIFQCRLFEGAYQRVTLLLP